MTEVQENLIDQYGLITLNDIRDHASVYENALVKGAQNASQMYNCLYSSLSDKAKLIVLSDVADYTIVTEGGAQVRNRPCFLKVIIRNTKVDTLSTVFHIHESLSHLEGKMLELTYNVEAFNIYVAGQVEQLTARGTSSSNLLINLFASFMAVPDKKICQVMQKDKFNKGEDATTRKLRQVALTKYKDRSRSDTWQTPSAEEEQIIGLTAQISHLRKENSNSAKAPKRKATMARSPTKQRLPKSRHGSWSRQ
jgi:hypothetical protein